jgi:hypothetical protein
LSTPGKIDGFDRFALDMMLVDAASATDFADFASKTSLHVAPPQPYEQHFDRGKLRLFWQEARDFVTTPP